MTSKITFSRRHFLRTTLQGVAVLSSGVWSASAAAGSRAANEKLQIACIGTAHRAAADIEELKQEDIVALVDVDRIYLEQAAAKFPAARTYADYREMLASEAGRIDAVMVGTPDHHHAPATLRAIQAGLHVYCEKPLTHTVHEARLVAQAASKYGVATQMGTQIHAGENYRRVVELIQGGIIGEVREVHVWVGKGWGGGERPAGSQTPPTTFDWDLWLGPAPQRPYWPDIYHPGKWRRWWAFGQGTLGDMACHYMDLPFWALQLRHPTHCAAEGPPVHPETCPLGLTVRYRFPARGTLPPVDLTWYDGDMIPQEVAGENMTNNKSGVMFVGSEGNMYANYTGKQLFPTEKFADAPLPPPSLPRSIGHHKEWIKACKEGTPTTCNFDYSGALTEAVLLGNVSYRVGQGLQWDADKLQATNCPEANEFISQPHRQGWEVDLDNPLDA